MLGVRLISDRGAGTSSDQLVVEETPAPVDTDVRPREQPTQLGTLLVRNAGRVPITLVSAGLGRYTQGLALAGFGVLLPNENDAALGGQCGPFPPPNFATHPVEGSVLGPGDTASIVVALQATREGDFTLDGIRVSYDAGGKRRRQDLPLTVTLHSRASNAPCRFDPTPHQHSAT